MLDDGTAEVQNFSPEGELEATFDWSNGIETTGEGKVFVHDLHSGSAGENGRMELNSGSVRLLMLPSLTEELISIYDSKGEDAMMAAYHAYRADEATAGLLDEAEVSGWGYATLPVLPAAAITIFRLNAESYPDSWRVHEALGDAYARTGQTAEAARAFERALELDPDNQTLLEKLRQVGRPD